MFGKNITFAIVAILAALTIGGCGGISPASGPTGNTMEIELWKWDGRTWVRFTGTECRERDRFIATPHLIGRGGVSGFQVFTPRSSQPAVCDDFHGYQLLDGPGQYRFAMSNVSRAVNALPLPAGTPQLAIPRIAQIGNILADGSMTIEVAVTNTQNSSVSSNVMVEAWIDAGAVVVFVSDEAGNTWQASTGLGLPDDATLHVFAATRSRGGSEWSMPFALGNIAGGEVRKVWLQAVITVRATGAIIARNLGASG